MQTIPIRAATIRVLAIALSLFVALMVLPAAAQKDAVATATRDLTRTESELRTVDRAMDTRIDDDTRRDLRSRAAAAGRTADDAIAALVGELTQADARLAGLGAASSGEAPDISRQRAEIIAQRNRVDAALKRAKLVDVDAAQLVTEIDQSEAKEFAQTVSTRVPSPLTPAFWGPVLHSIPRDFRRIGLFLDQGGAQIAKQWRGGVPWPAGLCLLAALALLFPARISARTFGQRLLIEGAPGHRIRRSCYALWRVFVGTVMPLLAAMVVVQGLRWSGLLPQRWSGLLDSFIVASGFAGFAGAVTGAVLMRSQPSWRIAPIEDDTATRLRPLSWALAALAFVTLMLTSFNMTVGASRAAVAASQAVVALLHQALIVVFLLDLGRVRTEQDDDDAEATQTRAGVGVAELVLWVAVSASIGALLLGYLGLSFTIVQFINWATVLGSATFLLTRAADDIITTILTRQSTVGRGLGRALGFRGSTIDQLGLAIAGVMRVGLVIVACGMLLSPFGAGGGVIALFTKIGQLAEGFQVGGVSVSPGSIIRGVLVLVVGLAMVRGFLGWLENRYLPVTELDGSTRNSVSLIARYVGISLATIWALASLGIGVEKIALLLSALSVGIGFGLQAITQNFISGLILLAERPIKIGDLIKVGADEGDVKRINVRSTEIELGDHSTLIVPNSELITKSVLNKTLSSPLGRVQIQFSVPIEADADKVREIVLDAYAAEEAIFDEPAPSIFIDSITDGRIVFNSFAHVSGPRAAYSARSNVYLAVLRRLREEHIDIGTVAQRLELAGSLPAPSPRSEPEDEA